MKTGDDHWRLQDDFKQLCSRYSNMHLDGSASPLQVLRAMVPEVNESAPRTLDCDPALVLGHEEPRVWQGYLDEAKRVLPRFNRELSGAIKLDAESDSGRSFRCGLLQVAEANWLLPRSRLREQRPPRPRAPAGGSSQAGLPTSLFWRSAFRSLRKSSCH